MCLWCYVIVGRSHFTWTLTLLPNPLLLKTSACGMSSTFLLSLQLLTPAHSQQVVSSLTSLSVFSFIQAPFPPSLRNISFSTQPHISSLLADCSLASGLQDLIHHILVLPSLIALSLLLST